MSATAQSSNDADVSATPVTVLVDGDALPTLKRDLYALDDGVGAFDPEAVPLSVLDVDAYIWVIDRRDTFVPDRDHIFLDSLHRMIADQPGDAETVLEWSVLRLVDDRDGRIYRVRLVLAYAHGLRRYPALCVAVGVRDVIYSVDTEGGEDATSDPFGGMERCRAEGWSTPLDAVEQ
ncbi:hypothetical protein [uncultured Tateyamaria sp.]|uniref:hypothetical protein n=1 Tax=uncultured Tateyamaria sp. TaxID=455651 RepID=UPI00261136B6|nr:hypothetical protein [uncultured Tateyamaria sp.]